MRLLCDELRRVIVGDNPAALRDNWLPSDTECAVALNQFVKIFFLIIICKDFRIFF